MLVIRIFAPQVIFQLLTCFLLLLCSFRVTTEESQVWWDFLDPGWEWVHVSKFQPKTGLTVLTLYDGMFWDAVLGFVWCRWSSRTKGTFWQMRNVDLRFKPKHFGSHSFNFLSFRASRVNWDKTVKMVQRWELFFSIQTKRCQKGLLKILKSLLFDWETVADWQWISGDQRRARRTDLIIAKLSLVYSR